MGRLQTREFSGSGSASVHTTAPRAVWGGPVQRVRITGRHTPLLPGHRRPQSFLLGRRIWPATPSTARSSLLRPSSGDTTWCRGKVTNKRQEEGRTPGGPGGMGGEPATRSHHQGHCRGAAAFQKCVIVQGSEYLETVTFDNHGTPALEGVFKAPPHARGEG